MSLKDTIITLKNKKIIADLQAELESDKKNFIASKLLGPQAVGSSSSVVKVADVAGPRIWPKTQSKRFLVHTASLDSFTLELSTIQIFWAANPSGMPRTFKKLGEKQVFEHIFDHFMLILLKNS